MDFIAFGGYEGSHKKETDMTLTVKQALENIYTSLHSDNENIDLHIIHLQEAMKSEGMKEVVVDTARLVQNNRQGRKMMQSYFKKRGVTVTFAAA